MRNDSKEICLPVFSVSSYGMGKDVHSLTLSIRHFFCRRYGLVNITEKRVINRKGNRFVLKTHD